jgi:hypothetical protein
MARECDLKRDLYRGAAVSKSKMHGYFFCRTVAGQTKKATR